jgi:biopolymer transport protein ExbB/TolQ
MSVASDQSIDDARLSIAEIIGSDIEYFQADQEDRNSQVWLEIAAVATSLITLLLTVVSVAPKAYLEQTAKRKADDDYNTMRDKKANKLNDCDSAAVKFIEVSEAITRTRRMTLENQNSTIKESITRVREIKSNVTDEQFHRFLEHLSQIVLIPPERAELIALESKRQVEKLIGHD